MTGQCLCGAVNVSIDTKPAFIHDCNCSFCRKSGGAWGYFPTGQVRTSGETRSFLRTDKANAAAAVHACTICGGTTHWVLSEAFRTQNPTVDLMGVNMRLFDPDTLDGVDVRFPDGKGWTGEGPFRYRRQAMTISTTAPW